MSDVTCAPPLQDSDTEGTISTEVDDILGAWRARVVGIVLVVAALVAAPTLVFVLLVEVFHLARPLRFLVTLLCLMTIFAACRPRWSLQRRTAILLAALGVFAFCQMAVNQLEGSGRITLVTLPLVALVLAGTRAGWLMAALSMGIYGLAAWLTQTGMLDTWRSAANLAMSTSFWILQGARLGSAILVLLVLLTQLQALQRRTLIAERKALRKLENESAARQRLEREIAQVGDNERCALGAELHDGLCQQLTATLLNCATLEAQMMTSALPNTGAVARIRDGIENAIGQARDVARGLCPLSLNLASLPAALESLCQETQKRSGIVCRFETDGVLPAHDHRAALQLFRIAGEALANAVRHAHASEIAVACRAEAGAIVLIVADNGRGFPTLKNISPGMGRHIMAHRAALAGGCLAIDAAPGGGTVVTCRIAVPPEPDTLEQTPTPCTLPQVTQ